MSAEMRKYMNLFESVSSKVIVEDDKPPFMGTNNNEIIILSKSHDDAFSYVPTSPKYWNNNTDNSLISKITGHYDKNNERDYERYSEDIANKKFFFIYYSGKKYIYLPGNKILYDKSQNRIKSSEQSQVFNQQIGELIKNAINA